MSDLSHHCLEMSQQIISSVGIVFDAKRNFEGDFEIPKCTVFGISAEEYEVFAEQHGIEVLPKQFSPDAHRYLMMVSPFRVMRVLGSMGYRIPVTPAGGRGPTATGERRMGVYTLVKEYLGDRNVELSI